VAVAALMAAAMVAAPTAAHADDATADDVYAGLGLSGVETHYVVLVDTSGSMETNNLYRYVKDGLTSFAGALDPLDTMTMIAFNETPADACFTGSVFEPSEVLRCLPKKATGKSTDIGAAVDAALTDLKAAKAPVSIVLLISDGDQAAPDGSPYGAPSLKSPAWAALRKRADALPNLYAYALQLGKSTSAKTLGVVFRNTQTLNAKTADEVRGKLAPPKDEVLRKAAHGLLAPDMNKPVTVSWNSKTTGINAADGGVDIQLTIQSDAEYVPLTLTGVSLVQEDGKRLDVDYLPSKIELLPNVPYVALVHVAWSVPPWPRLSDHPVNVLAHLRLQMTVTSSWDKVIGEQKLKRTTQVLGEQSITISGSGVAGRSISFFIGLPLLVIALIVLVIALIRRRRRDSPAEFMAVTYQRAMR
jgi:hypothetical protein